MEQPTIWLNLIVPANEKIEKWMWITSCMHVQESATKGITIANH